MAGFGGVVVEFFEDFVGLGVVEFVWDFNVLVICKGVFCWVAEWVLFLVIFFLIILVLLFC